MIVLLFMAAGFLGQLAASVVTELLRPWLAHLVMHNQLRRLAISLGGSVSCPMCSEQIRGGER
jgi:hypothetical protein